MKNIYIEIKLILLVLTVNRTFAQNQREIELERQINKVIQSYPIAGIGVSVLNADTVFYMNGFGYSNLEKKKKYTTTTIQNIASISKTTIAISLLKAEELGLLKLEDPINKHLPFRVFNPYFKGDEICILQLATHTSGIKDRSVIYDVKCYIEADKAVMSLKEFVFTYFDPTGKWYSKNNFIDKKPGEIYQYSNTAAALAAYLIEYKSGMSYADFTKKYIFDPLKLKNTGWYLSDIDMELHSKLYNSDLKERELYQLITYPDGGLRTCVADLSKYFQMILNSGQLEGAKIIEKESVEKMIKPRFDKNNMPENFEMINQGIFWEIERSPAIVEMRGHSGGDPGVITMMFYLPESKTGIIYMANTNSDIKNIKGYNEIFKILTDYAGKIGQL